MKLANCKNALAALGIERIDSHHLRLSYQPTQMALGAVLAAVGAAGLTISDLSTEEADLQDIFLSLTAMPGHPAVSA